MKKSKSKTQAKSTKAKKPASKAKKEKQSGELVEPKQELFYYGPPPAIKALELSNSGYDKDFHPRDMLAQLRQGAHPDEIAASWGIKSSTLLEWVEAYAELAEARAVGATAYNAYWFRALKLSAFGQLVKVRENSLFKVLDNQVGFDNHGGGHAFADVQNDELVFIDENGKES